MFVIETALKALRQAGQTVTAVDEVFDRIERAAERMRQLPKQKSSAELAAMRNAAEAETGEGRHEAFIALAQAQEENLKLQQETIRHGETVQRLRNEALMLTRKAATSCYQRLGRELESLLRDRIALYTVHPSEAPQRCAEIVAQAEAVARSFFPEAVPDFLSGLSPDIARIAYEKRKTTSVSVEV